MTANAVAREQFYYWMTQGLMPSQMCARVGDYRGPEPDPEEVVESIGTAWCGLASVRAERLAEAGIDA